MQGVKCNMDDTRKEKYQRLMYNIQSIANSIENVKSTLRNIRPVLDASLLINNESVEEDNLTSIERQLSDSKNRIYSIARTLRYNMNK